MSAPMPNDPVSSTEPELSPKLCVADTLRAVLRDVLSISPERASAFDDDSELFGALPELDSMAVATVLTEVEDRFSIIIDDSDVDAELFETFGNLRRFIEEKRES